MLLNLCYTEPGVDPYPSAPSEKLLTLGKAWVPCRFGKPLWEGGDFSLFIAPRNTHHIVYETTQLQRDLIKNMGKRERPQ